MAASYLTRTDAERNMRRFYRLDVQPTLVGKFALFREWGRIGRAGQVKSTPYPTPADAIDAFRKQQQCKVRRGYVVLPDVLSLR